MEKFIINFLKSELVERILKLIKIESFLALVKNIKLTTIILVALPFALLIMISSWILAGSYWYWLLLIAALIIYYNERK